ncbi:hypothetical protein DENSPDRAFT_885549 [Dentipellis sp. KUC8613]|nr:hypothetical protein DENSPDRAFT_885549 [Dentipellis sp. KUC8613]
MAPLAQRIRNAPASIQDESPSFDSLRSPSEAEISSTLDTADRSSLSGSVPGTTTAPLPIASDASEPIKSDATSSDLLPTPSSDLEQASTFSIDFADFLSLAGAKPESLTFSLPSPTAVAKRDGSPLDVFPTPSSVSGEILTTSAIDFAEFLSLVGAKPGSLTFSLPLPTPIGKRDSPLDVFPTPSSVSGEVLTTSSIDFAEFLSLVGAKPGSLTLSLPLPTPIGKRDNPALDLFPTPSSVSGEVLTTSAINFAEFLSLVGATPGSLTLSLPPPTAIAKRDFQTDRSPISGVPSLYAPLLGLALVAFIVAMVVQRFRRFNVVKEQTVA